MFSVNHLQVRNFVENLQNVFLRSWWICSTFCVQYYTFHSISFFVQFYTNKKHTLLVSIVYYKDIFVHIFWQTNLFKLWIGVQWSHVLNAQRLLPSKNILQSEVPRSTNQLYPASRSSQAHTVRGSVSLLTLHDGSWNEWKLQQDFLWTSQSPSSNLLKNLELIKCELIKTATPKTTTDGKFYHREKSSYS